MAYKVEVTFTFLGDATILDKEGIIAKMMRLLPTQTQAEKEDLVNIAIFKATALSQSDDELRDLAEKRSASGTGT